MRRLTVTAEQYNRIVYYSCITTPAKDMAAWQLMVDVTKKLRAAGEPNSDNPDDKNYKLIGESATFDFENAEASAIVRRIKDTMPLVPFLQFMDAGLVIAQLERKPTEETAEVADA